MNSIVQKTVSVSRWLLRQLNQFLIEPFTSLGLSRALQLAVFASGGLAAFCVTLLAADRFSPTADVALVRMLFWSIVAFYFAGFGQVLMVHQPALPNSPRQKFYELYSLVIVIALVGQAYGLPNILESDLQNHIGFDRDATETEIEFYFTPPEPQKYPKSFAPAQAD